MAVPSKSRLMFTNTAEVRPDVSSGGTEEMGILSGFRGEKAA